LAQQETLGLGDSEPIEVPNLPPDSMLIEESYSNRRP
jgi:hypothetical protein